MGRRLQFSAFSPGMAALSRLSGNVIGAMQLQKSSAISWRRSLFAIAAFLLLAMMVVRFIAPFFPYGAYAPGWATFILIALLMGAGGAYAFLSHSIPANGALTNRQWWIILALGLAMRGIFFGGPETILEDDWRRYLWDGAIVSAGVNPYLFTPANVLYNDELSGGYGGDERLREDYERVSREAKEADGLLETINYPYVTTIYPPIAQAAFALAHQLAPYNLDAWRFVLLLSDLVAFGLLLGALQAFGRSRLWALLYWWNPLLIFTIFNGAHMDALLAPFLIGFIWLLRAGRRGWASAALAGAAGVKFWPILLAPFLVRFSARYWRSDLGVALIFTFCVALVLGPMLITIATGVNSGLFAYAETWQVNSFFFPVFSTLLHTLGGEIGSLARILLAISIVGLSIGLAWRIRPDGSSKDQNLLGAYVMVTVLALFAFSPTGYPWYFLWVSVFLPFVSSAPLRMATASFVVVLPLYYARYHFGLHDATALFNATLAPIEFLTPPIVFLLMKRRRRDAV